MDSQPNIANNIMDKLKVLEGPLKTVMKNRETRENAAAENGSVPKPSSSPVTIVDDEDEDPAQQDNHTTTDDTTNSVHEGEEDISLFLSSSLGYSTLIGSNCLPMCCL